MDWWKSSQDSPDGTALFIKHLQLKVESSVLLPEVLGSFGEVEEDIRQLPAEFEKRGRWLSSL